MPDCSAIRDELTGLKQERADLQDELRPFPEINLATKAQIIAGIKKLNVKIAEKEKELDNCLGIPPRAVPVSAAFTGTATIRTSNLAFSASTPFPVTGNLVFSGQNHSIVDVSIFFMPRLQSHSPYLPMSASILFRLPKLH